MGALREALGAKGHRNSPCSVKARSLTHSCSRRTLPVRERALARSAPAPPPPAPARLFRGLASRLRPASGPRGSGSVSRGSRLDEASATYEGVRHPQDPPRGQGSARRGCRVRALGPAPLRALILPAPPTPGWGGVGEGAAEPRAPSRDLGHPRTQGDSASPGATLEAPGRAG